MKAGVIVVLSVVAVAFQCVSSLAAPEQILGRIRLLVDPGTSNVQGLDVVIEDACLISSCTTFAASNLYYALATVERTYADSSQGQQGHFKNGQKYACFRYQVGADPLEHYACHFETTTSRGVMRRSKHPPLGVSKLTSDYLIALTGLLYKDQVFGRDGKSLTVFSLALDAAGAQVMYNSLLMSAYLVPSDDPSYATARRKSGKDFYCLRYGDDAQSASFKCKFDLSGARGRIRHF